MRKFVFAAALAPAPLPPPLSPRTSDNLARLPRRRPGRLRPSEHRRTRAPTASSTASASAMTSSPATPCSASRPRRPIRSADESVAGVVIAGDELRVRAGRDLYVGGRVGVVVGGNTLLYAKAGYTNARVRVDYEDGTAGTVDRLHRPHQSRRRPRRRRRADRRSAPTPMSGPSIAIPTIRTASTATRSSAASASASELRDGSNEGRAGRSDARPFFCARSSRRATLSSRGRAIRPASSQPRGGRRPAGCLGAATRIGDRPVGVFEKLFNISAPQRGLQFQGVLYMRKIIAVGRSRRPVPSPPAFAQNAAPPLQRRPCRGDHRLRPRHRRRRRHPLRHRRRLRFPQRQCRASASRARSSNPPPAIASAASASTPAATSTSAAASAPSSPPMSCSTARSAIRTPASR